ncbi:MAG: hypothetical protein JST70_18920 [Bacteroidetes bacterium]|nr:hypothetical protein [Bacteroidota bacterium]
MIFRYTYIILLSLLLPLIGYSQNATVQGNVSMPSLIDLEVTYPNNLQIGFDNLEEFAHGKEYRNCINLSVKSNCPWVVSVKSRDNMFSAQSSGKSIISPDIISLKESRSVAYTPVSNVLTPLIISNNDDVINQYTLDLKMATPWNAEGGQYGLNLIFSISAQ